MKALEFSRYEMLMRARDYGASRADVFRPDTRGGERFAALYGNVDRLSRLIAEEMTGHAARRDATNLKAMAREELIGDLEAIALTSRGIALTIPGVAQRFVVPYSVRDQVLIAAARSFAENARPLEAEFITRHMDKGFLDDLSRDITAFETAARDQESGRQKHKDARRSIDEEMAAAFEALVELDGIVANEFKHNAEEKRRWDDARRVDRKPQKAAEEEPEVEAAGAPGAAASSEDATPTS